MSAVRVSRQARICSSPYRTLIGFAWRALLHLVLRWCCGNSLSSQVVAMARSGGDIHTK
ncbi:hypothetical protein RHMOL_Rhmol04G0351500 [Rhododendron molle]|uniref:Uncharacterized protein n=1 Tax=Rhododendron molle TaxID=49168 RepID=A0ACC0P9Z2_RHOML|nr:hypothetical protein RHMOL_Rhmol04G0351500 [Rhododendron molle]